MTTCRSSGKQDRLITENASDVKPEDAQCQASPDAGTEIERHPEYFLSPLREVVRHHATHAHVAEALERTQPLIAVENVGTPPGKIHRDVDRHEKRQVARDSNDGDDENPAGQTFKLPQQAAEANSDREEG